jgi:3-dehydroquinate synthase
MQTLHIENCPIYFSSEAYNALNKSIKDQAYSSIFVLTDTQTQEHCSALFLQQIETEKRIEVLEIEAGEKNKNLDTCSQLWETLSELGADRKSLFINLGGGVVTDLGGFVASCFRRGIDFIHVPTSLLGMVDASIGGKNGVDLGMLKNQVGVIRNPKMILVDTSFLSTLPPNELRSGLAEMLKHGLIYDKQYWSMFLELDKLGAEDLDLLIYASIQIKIEVVKQDPTENGIRKILNFGHTLGHAIESFSLTHHPKPLLHGEAIAIGMLLEGYISSKLLAFPTEELQQITEVVTKYYPNPTFSFEEIEEIIQLLKYDKKNSDGNINFVLLHQIGECKIDAQVENELIYEAFEYLKKEL